MSVSSYRAGKDGGTTERKRPVDGQMLALIRILHAESDSAYGRPRTTQELRDRGVKASKARVEWLMGKTAFVRDTSGATRRWRIRSTACRWRRTCCVGTSRRQRRIRSGQPIPPPSGPTRTGPT
ncbi:MAG: transposase [Candidatus Accumulibacter sp.]|nr:transposase [Accumulibacter sp.]